MAVNALEDPRHYVLDDDGLRLVIRMAIERGWQLRAEVLATMQCKCGAPLKHEVAPRPEEIGRGVSEVKGAIEMALQQADARPKPPSLYGPDGNTPLSYE